MKKLLIFIISIVFFLNPQNAFASTLFQDNFNDGDSSGWEEHLGSQGTWSVQNGEYVGRVVKDRPEDLPNYSLGGDVDWTDYRFEVKLKGDQGVDKIILVRFKSLSQNYSIKLISSWPDWYGDKLALLKNNFVSWTANTTFINSIGVWYKIGVEVRGNNIKVFINDSATPLINYTDSINPNLSGRIGLMTWPGYYGGYGSVTVNRFDDVVVSSLELTPPQDNLILLPGMGASWNHQDMILGQSQPPENWTMTPGIKTYDGLIQTLKNAGYALGTNFYVFNYDWRKKVDEVADDLKNFLERHPPPEGKKIDLVGHSLGGLVARTYLQKYPVNNVDQLVTVGSPHQGTVKSYYFWEGADLPKGLTGWQRIAAGILLQLHKNQTETNVEAIQRFIPGFKDILPTFNFLKENGNEIPISLMQEQNTWLGNLNTSFSNDLAIKSGTITGNGNSTARYLEVEKRSLFDQLLGRWVDGRPVDIVNDDGDNTVLSFSSKLNNTTSVNLANTGHGELIEKTQGQEAVMNLLQLTPSSIMEAPYVAYIPALVLQLASPTTMTVFDPNGRQIDQGKKLVVITNPLTGQYRVRVEAEGTGGKYRLLTGRLVEDQDVWIEIPGEVSPFSPREHLINFNQGLAQTKNELLNLARMRIGTAKEQAELLSSQSLISQLEAIINKIDLAIKKYNNGQIDQTQRDIEHTIEAINRLERKSIENGEILKLLREGQDYLVQAHEIN